MAQQLRIDVRLPQGHWAGDVTVSEQFELGSCFVDLLEELVMSFPVQSDDANVLCLAVQNVHGLLDVVHRTSFQ